MSDTYIPNARDTIVGYFGASGSVLRQHCVKCNDKDPLTSYGPGATKAPYRIFGDLYVATGDMDRIGSEGCCDRCGVSFLTLSLTCQREHDEQQARFARQPVHVVVEYGVRTAVRCRVY